MVSKILFASFMGLALAQTTVVTFSVPADDDSDSSTTRHHTSSTVDNDFFQASVIAVSAGATTLEVNCQTKSGSSSDDDDSDFCTDFKGTYVYGATTLGIAQSMNDTLWATVNCPSLSSLHGTCTASVAIVDVSASDAIPSGSASVGPTDFQPFTVTITAGAEKLAATGSTGSVSQNPSASSTGGSQPKKTGNAAAANSVMLGGSLLGVAAGVFGGLL